MARRAIVQILFLPTPLFLILKSFLSNRTFTVRCDDETSDPHTIKTGVPQGSILSPTLYNIYTADLPQSINTTLATFSDDTAIITTNSDTTTAITYLQDHLTQLQDWFRLWKPNLTKTNPLISPLPSGLPPFLRFT